MLRWLALAALVAAGCVSAADAQQYDPDKDFNTLSGAGNTPTGIWSDGATMWVTDPLDNKIYAYHTSNMSRDSSRDFNTLSAAGNTEAWGIWSDGATMWVGDVSDSKIYAYHTSNMSRDSSRDFNTLSGAGNTSPRGIWSDDATMWVGDDVADRIYAYKMSDRTRDPSKDFNTLSGAGNTAPAGIWSDGATMWVSDQFTTKIYAYKMSDRTRDPSKDFNTLSGAGNTAPAGIWSDGATMWVGDISSGKIYAYKMHPAPTTSPPRVFVYIPPPDTTPPTVKSVERTGNATTTNRALTWEVTFSERVVLRTNIHANYTQHFHALTLPNIHTNYTSVANATIPDLGMVYDTMMVDVPGVATGGSVSVDLHHPITSGLLIELVAPDCTRFVVHNQTTTFLYKLRQPYDLGDLDGVGAAGQWTLYVSDHAKYWNGTLNGWTLELESAGAVEGSGRTYTITQYVAGPGEYTLSLDGYTIWDRAGNRLVDTDPAVNEPYHVVGAAARTCHME